MLYYIIFTNLRAERLSFNYDMTAAEKNIRRLTVMKHIKTLTTRNLKESMKKGGCGECQTSCQSACKTSCTVGNQSCEQVKTEI